MEELDPKELHELVIKCWMTHDGMWFMHCLENLGIEVTNRLNKAASRSIGSIEIRRVKDAVGIKEILDFDTFRELIRSAWSVLSGDFMDFKLSFPSGNTLLVRAGRCFALEGMKRLKVADKYECGIFSRVEGWFDGLSLKYGVRPKVLRCMMLEQGECYREYTFPAYKK